MIRLAGKRRLTKSELEDLRDNSGITNLQYNIIKLKYFDPEEYSVIRICDMLKISDGTYRNQLHKAEAQIINYYNAKSAHI